MEFKSQLGIDFTERRRPLSKSMINFTLYHSLLGKQIWSPLRFSNGCLCFGDPELLDTFLTRIIRQPNKWVQFLEINLFSFYERSKPKDTKLFTRYVLRGSLEEVLDVFLEERRIIRSIMKEKGKLELNKKVSMLILELGPQELVELKDPNVASKLLNLLTDSSNERMHFFILTQYGDKLPTAVMESFEWKAFLGDKNIAFARNIFRDLDEELYNVNRKLVGMLKDNTRESLVPLHDVIYEASDYKKEKDRVSDIEEKAFEDFLKSM